MRIMIVAATAEETAPLMVRQAHHERVPHDVDILITGVGMVAAAARTSGALARTGSDLALNLGICGSFDPALSLGTVVHVVSDGMPELGAEDGEAFLSIEELGLLRGDAAPFFIGRLVSAEIG